MVGIFSVVYSYVHAFKNQPLLSQIHSFFHLKRRKVRLRGRYFFSYVLLCTRLQKSVPVVTKTPVLSLKKREKNKTKIKNKSIYFVRRNL